MSLDKKISEAISEAVIAADQSPALARRLIAWMEALTSGNESFTDPASVERHLEVLFEGTVTNRTVEELY